MKQCKVLLSAYACEPGKGSEAGVGWNIASELAKYCEVWVITRSNNCAVIESHLNQNSSLQINFIYYDLPAWARWWKRGNRGIQLYYYLWQVGIYRVVKKNHQKVKFDIIHHVTFGKYWVPSFLSLLPIKFIWGPVGGGESMPKTFFPKSNYKSLVFEYSRIVARWIGEHDPFVRLTARKSRLAFATTDETAERLREIGCKNVHVMPQVSFSNDLIQTLSSFSCSEPERFRFISIGRPLYWKGFHLGLRAFAHANMKNTEYWLIANGDGKQELLKIANNLNIEDKVFFIDRLPTLEDIYKKVGECNVLVHPALHEAFGTVVLEAMAIGKPIICLNLGGPALQVTEETGFKIAALSPEQAINDMAEAMLTLAKNPELARQMGEAGRKRVAEQFSWESKGEIINQLYREILSGV